MSDCYHGNCGLAFLGASEMSGYVYREINDKLQIVYCLGIQDTGAFLSPEAVPLPEPNKLYYKCADCIVRKEHVIRIVQLEADALNRLLAQCPLEIVKNISLG